MSKTLCPREQYTVTVEEQIALPNRIKLRILSPDLLAHVGIHILLEHAHGEDGQRGEEEVVGGDVPVVVKRLGRIGRVESEKELRHGIRDVLVKEIGYQLGQTNVRPPSVDEEEPLQEPELCNGVVAVLHSLVAFFAEDADANVRLFEHWHIVGTIPDGQSYHLRHATFDEVHDLGLLRLRCATNHSGRTRDSVVEEVFGHFRVPEHLLQRPTADHYGVLAVISWAQWHQYRLGLVFVRRVDDVDAHLLHVQQPTRLGDLHCCVELVTGDHPDGYVSHPESLDALGNAVLDLVLSARGRQQHATQLDLTVQVVELPVLLLRLQNRPGNLSLSPPLLPIAGFDGFAPEAESAEAQLGVGVHRSLDARHKVGQMGRALRQHHVIRTFAVERNDLCVWVPDDDGGSFPGVGELDQPQQVELLGFGAVPDL
mmetsp:Transcript_3970/g.9062  ORF Transcript_3970/g.9062 Transcript_3970/m.9062 type:complete len:427 (+) Transcript_3970:1529-2809(+)